MDTNTKKNLGDFENEPFLNPINNNREYQHQPNPEPSTEIVDNIAPFEIETIENHIADPSNPPLHLSEPVILAVNESFDNLNHFLTYSNNM